MPDCLETLLLYLAGTWSASDNDLVKLTRRQAID